MFRNLLVLSICVVVARASGEFSVLDNPKSLSFKGNEPLESKYVGDVLYAAAGLPVAEDADWSGLTINDPFAQLGNVIVVLVEGTNHVHLNAKAKTYPLEGSSAARTLNAVSAELEAASERVCNMDFNQFDEAVITYRDCFGDLAEPPIVETKALNPALYNGDKQFLQTVGFINAAADNFKDMATPNNFIFFQISLDSISKGHGQKSEAWSEAKKLVSSAIGNLKAAAAKASQNDVLTVVIASESENRRSKRDTVEPSPDNTYNLANYVSPDYPIMFNIILWFIVAFFLSLLAICYAIGSMDPGRDSIIYRMTSTRMKKDN